MGPTVCLNPLENIKISCLYLATGRSVSTFVIITFLLLLCSGFYPNLPHLSHFLCLLFLSQIFLSMLFEINISYSIYFVSIFPSVFFKFPAIHCLLFFYLFLLLCYFLPCLLPVCLFFSRFHVTHLLPTQGFSRFITTSKQRVLKLTKAVKWYNNPIH